VLLALEDLLCIWFHRWRAFISRTNTHCLPHSHDHDSPFWELAQWDITQQSLHNPFTNCSEAIYQRL